MLPARLPDRPELVELRKRAAEELASRRWGELLREDLRTDTSIPDPEDPRGELWILARLGGSPAGYARLRLGTRSELVEIFVAPELRGIGVGHELLEAGATSASQAGSSSLDATVLPGDRAAKNFFESHGMVARVITVHTSLEQR